MPEALDYSQHTLSELDESLRKERNQMTTWARIANAAPSAKGRKSALQEHDKAQGACLAILAEFQRRGAAGATTEEYPTHDR